MPTHHAAWNKGRLLGQKPRRKPKEIWSLRIRLQLTGNVRDLVSLKVRDVYQGSAIATRAIVMERKTHRPVS